MDVLGTRSDGKARHAVPALFLRRLKLECMDWDDLRQRTWTWRPGFHVEIEV